MQELPLCAARTALQGVAAAVIVVAGVQAASATSNEKAISLCQDELLNNRGATAVSDIKTRRRSSVPFVYGSAELSDGRTVQFRCRVYHDQVTSISYLEADASSGSGDAWKPAGPPAVVPSDGAADEAAKAPPPADDSGEEATAPEPPAGASGGSGRVAIPAPPAGASGGVGSLVKPAPPADGEGDAAEQTPPAESATGPIFIPAPK